MRLVLATNHLGLGGSESYLVTVAEQFDRLGHEVTIFSREIGEGAVPARARGLRVVEEPGLPMECDAILAQDAGVSLDLAARFPGVRQVFVAHSESFDLQLPPQLAGIVDVVVVLNDRVGDRVAALAVRTDVVRLRQPIDVERFVSAGPLPRAPRRALLLSNNPVADRLAAVAEACDSLGIELLRVGGDAGQKHDLSVDLSRVEIVIGYGRSVLEAMACGRAAYVYDRHGGDGWVTPDSYPSIEAAGFSGRAGGEAVNPLRLRSDLAAFDPQMGPVNHDLVVSHHRANEHAQRLLELLDGPGREPSVRAPLEEMARLVRLEWRARVDAQALAVANSRLAAEKEELRARLVVAEADRQAVAAEVGAGYRATLSWRLTRPLRAIGRLRRRRQRHA